MSANGLALGEEADFEALNYLPALNLIRSTKLHLRIEPAFLPNACYSQWFLFYDVYSVSSSTKFLVAKFIKFIVEFIEAKTSRSSILSITEK